MTSEAQISEQQNLDEIALAYRSNHDVQWLLRQLAASRASEARLRAALEHIGAHEWEPQETMSGTRALFCPACSNPKTWASEWTRQRHAATDRADGHRQGCWLAIALEPIRAQALAAAAAPHGTPVER